MKPIVAVLALLLLIVPQFVISHSHSHSHGHSHSHSHGHGDYGGHSHASHGSHSHSYSESDGKYVENVEEIVMTKKKQNSQQDFLDSMMKVAGASSTSMSTEWEAILATVAIGVAPVLILPFIPAVFLCLFLTLSRTRKISSEYCLASPREVY